MGSFMGMKLLIKQKNIKMLASSQSFHQNQTSLTFLILKITLTKE
jgi:hypothetical protein